MSASPLAKQYLYFSFGRPILKQRGILIFLSMSASPLSKGCFQFFARNGCPFNKGDPYFEVFAVRRVFRADPLRSTRNPLGIFLTPNGRDRAKFSNQIPTSSNRKGRIRSDLNGPNSEQNPSRFRADSEQNLIRRPVQGSQLIY